MLIPPLSSLLGTIQGAPVASFLFAITLVTSLSDLLAPQQGIQGRFILHPYTMVRDKSQFYRLFTAGLLHGDWLHLFFNMFVFYQFGFMLEQMVGGLAFGGIYILSLALSGLPLVMRQKDNPQYYALGASGAIAGILFGFMTLHPDATLLVFFFPMQAWIFALVYLAFSWVASRQGADNVAHDAHFWGAISGFVLTLILVPGSWQRFTSWLSGMLG